MEKETRQKISEDYRKANESISEILSYERPNSVILGRPYLSPTTVVGISLKLEDMYGELEYFKEVRDCLEEILINEKTSIRIFNPPEYLQEFIEK